jgi:cytoskeleton protein RodZ
MDIGSKLQKVRQDQGISLREIANATKISPHILEALERNDLARLPGGIFARGYLRAYAAELGLDPEQVVAEFRDQVEPPPEERLPDPPADYVDWGARRRKLGIAAVFGLAAALIIYTAFVVRPADAPADQDMAGTVATGGELVDAPASTSAAVPTSVNSQQGLRLELQPRGECWVSATVDGRLVVYRLMAAGERATLDARDEVLLRVGDAGAFVYVINGTPGRPLGQPGQPVTIRITKGNYNAWLAGAGTPPDRGAVPHDTPSSPAQSTGV